MVKEIKSDSQFTSELASTNKLVVVDFFATWCGPCKKVAPIYEQLANQYQQDAVFLKVDVDICQQTAAQCEISAMPTFVLFKNKKKLDQVVGGDMNKLNQLIMKYKGASSSSSNGTSSQVEDNEPIPTHLSTAEDFKEEGNKRYKKGSYKKAAECYSKAIELDPSQAPIYTNRAACYLQLQQYKKVIEDALKAQQLDSKFAKAYLRAGQGYLQMGKTKEAKEQFELGLKIEPNSDLLKKERDTAVKIEKHLENAKNFLSQGLYKEASAEIDLALQLAPHSTILKLVKIESLIGLREFDTAAKEASTILRDVDSNNSDALFLRGQALYYAGNTDSGLNHITQALNLDPDNQKCIQFRKQIKKIEALKEEGNTLLRNGKYQEAYNEYTKAIEIDPKNANLNAVLYCNRAAAATKLGKHDVAIKDATKAIELNDSYLKAYMRRGSSYIELEQYEDAMRDYNKAHELDKDNEEIEQKLKEVRKLYKQSKKKDYYKILGIEKSASTDEIRKAYKKLAMQWHPDRYIDEEEKKNAENKFKDITEAHSILSDPQKRQQYDSGAMDADFEGGFHGGDMNDIFRMFFGGMGGMHMGGGFGGMSGGGFGRRGGGMGGGQFFF
ncbi:hypothetical protein FDP41_007577 [Naegleria fowleri]|uniref:DnaJ homolog subfamily C member 10 n=1 Tax=Naegleria fowleri TaxID=5763 RepID=A0A6A5C9L8_NAEFO|nr:uncharacterized protein FDP41_007577 [Naegleria fowleri]KAF0983662.1 hypothetical protein FDP41_007577 [Naegleria fowleri]CAG4716899.1 unnamed protein product [Naegleria fowleri]